MVKFKLYSETGLLGVAENLQRHSITSDRINQVDPAAKQVLMRLFRNLCRFQGLLHHDEFDYVFHKMSITIFQSYVTCI